MESSDAQGPVRPSRKDDEKGDHQQDEQPDQQCTKRALGSPTAVGPYSGGIAKMEAFSRHGFYLSWDGLFLRSALLRKSVSAKGMVVVRSFIRTSTL